jgi:hypothetical protein
MNQLFKKGAITACILLSINSYSETELITLKAIKDSFSRSNRLTANSGAAEALAIAHAPNIKSILTFDLSSLTNEIISASLRLHPHQSMDTPISITVAPMVSTPDNNNWGEGNGNLGVRGQNAQPGEANWAFSAHKSIPWQNIFGEGLENMGDPQLWDPPFISRLKTKWIKSLWMEAPLTVSVLEKRRTATDPRLTIGIWGTDGAGTYLISARNSQWAPELIVKTMKNNEE